MEVLLWIIVLKLLIHSWKWIGLPLKFWSFRGGNLIECLKSLFPLSCVPLVFECTELICWLTVVSKLWLIRGWLNWFCPTGFSCWLMHIGPWIVEVTGAWRFDWSWEPGINWLLHNWRGSAIFWLIEKSVLTSPCWLFTGCGNCRGAAITFDSEATWFGWKLGAAGFETVFWCGCSMSCMVIGGTLVECTPVIGLIHWLDCRQSFSKTILSVLLGRCEVLFATVGKQGAFADHSSKIDFRGIHLFLCELEKVQIFVAHWENYDIEDFCWQMNPDCFFALASLN